MALLKPKNPIKNQPKNNLLIWLILFIALAARLYKLNTPLADWHSWRQADTASVAVQYIKNGVDLLRPTYHDLSNIPSGKENPNGYRMVELPMMPVDVALLYKLFDLGETPVHVVMRLYSILFSLGSIFLLYKLVQLFESEKTALFSALMFAILPYNIFYSRTVLPEIGLVFFTLLELYAVARYYLSQNFSLKNPYFWLGGISGALAILIKPYALIFVLPMVYLAIKHQGIKSLSDWKTYLYLAIILAPYIWWRWWISYFPEGIPAFEWLFNGNGIRFKGAFFRWIFADRLGRLILGYWGLILLVLGFLKKSSNKFFGFWLFAILSYVFIIATGNVQHDYYQIITIPIISIYLGKGMVYLLDQKTFGSKIILITTVLFMFAFSWYEVRGYYNINNPAIVEAGEYVDQHVEPDALIIAPYQGDTAFLYQTNRQGWPIGGNIEQRIEQGADYYVTTTIDDEAKELMEKYQVIKSNENFTVIKLVESSKSFESPVNPVEQDKADVPTPTITPTPTPSPSPKLPPGLQKKLK